MPENENGEGRPTRELTIETKEQGKSHEELVGEFQKYVKVAQERSGGKLSPAYIIRDRLDYEATSTHFDDEDLSSTGKKFYFELRSAWDALAYDGYEPGSEVEKQAGTNLWIYYNHSREPTINLSPAQIRTIDALTEVAGIRHHRGQTAIPIPENLRNYFDWRFTDEYQTRVANAQRNRNTPPKT